MTSRRLRAFRTNAPPTADVPIMCRPQRRPMRRSARSLDDRSRAGRATGTILATAPANWTSPFRISPDRVTTPQAATRTPHRPANAASAVRRSPERRGTQPRPRAPRRRATAPPPPESPTTATPRTRRQRPARASGRRPRTEPPDNGDGATARVGGRSPIGRPCCDRRRPASTWAVVPGPDAAMGRAPLWGAPHRRVRGGRREPVGVRLRGGWRPCGWWLPPPRRRGMPRSPRRSACGPGRGSAARRPATSCPRRAAHR